MRSVRVWLTAILVVMIGLTACAKGSKTLATVNGQQISEKDLNARLNTFSLLYRHELVDEQAKQKMLQHLVEQTLLIQEANRRSLKADPKVVEEEKARFKEFLLFQVGQNKQGVAPHGTPGAPGAAPEGDPAQNEAKLNDELKKRNLTQKDLDAFINESLTVQLLYDDIAGSIKATDEEAREFYDKNQDKFTQPEQVKASHILVKTEEEAKKAAAEAKAAPDQFAELAKKYSTDPGSKDKGGDLGFFGRGQMVKPFEEAAFAMTPGQISDPIKSDFGFHIIRVAEKKAAVVLEFDKAKEQARQAVVDARQQEAFEKLMTELKADAKINPPGILENQG